VGGDEQRGPRRLQSGQRCERAGPLVFSSTEGKYLHNFKRYWRLAVTAAKIADFRFHDLRHTFASRLAMMPGVDRYTFQRAGGWKTPAIVQRYAHLSPDHMRAAVEKLARRIGARRPAREPAP
jgi:integrase